MELKGKKITVIGLGISGRSASLLLKKKGALVYATDSASSQEIKKTAKELREKGIFVEIGKHTDKFIKGSELVVASPGVSDSSEAMVIANENSIPIVSEIELASWFCKAPIIAVTGTNGKSTVVTLIGLILKAANKNPVVCGNIGEPFCDYVSEISPEQFAVLELSSFQLKRIRNFRPRVAAIINITQNHFDWHIDINDYFDAKKKIYENQKESDFTILNYDDSRLRAPDKKPFSQIYFFSRTSEVKGAYSDGRNILLKLDGEKIIICPVSSIRLKGEHNVSNILCACLCTYLFGVSPGAMKEVISQFEGLEHRFQEVANIDGVSFIDDSKATTVDACRAALSSCREKAVLIAGGRDKGSDFTNIRDLIKEKVKVLILIGEARGKIRKAIENSVEIYDANSMDEAVAISKDKAGKGEIVLLSPMCASFDMYRDYKKRGEAFCDAVDKLKNQNLMNSAKT